jgi:hypothetical protein
MNSHEEGVPPVSLPPASGEVFGMVPVRDRKERPRSGIGGRARRRPPMPAAVEAIDPMAETTPVRPEGDPPSTVDVYK